MKRKCVILNCENEPFDVFGFWMCEEHLGLTPGDPRNNVADRPEPLLSIDRQRDWVCYETHNQREDGWRVKFGPLDVWTPNKHLIFLAFRKSQEWGTYNPFYTVEHRRALDMSDERIFGTG